MQSIILTLHVLIALSIIALVLMQHGKGADVGASFGGGASNTMFGSQGAMPFLMKLTVLLAALFFATSLGMSYLVSRAQQHQKAASIMTTNSGKSRAPASAAVMDIPDAVPAKKTPQKKKQKKQ